MAKLQNLRGKYSEFEPHLEDIIFNLKERLTLAQANKNAVEATKLQEQIWTLKDYKAGYLANIDERLLKETFDLFQQALKQAELSNRNTNNNNPKYLDENEKKLKSLNKKKDQILMLIEKQSRGEKLEKNQLDKISNLEKIEQEIEKLKLITN